MCWGVTLILTSKMGLARIYQYTKFEVSSFTHSRFAEGGLKFNFWSLTMPFWGYFVMLEMGLANVYPYTEFEVFSFTHSRFTEGGLNFKIQFLVTGPRLRPFWGYFVMLEMGLAKVYPCTEFEVSSFTCSRFTKGGLKLKILPLDPDHATFGDIFSSVRWDLPGSIRTPNLKFLASPFPKILFCAVKWLDARGGVPKLARGSTSFVNGPSPNLASI